MIILALLNYHVCSQGRPLGGPCGSRSHRRLQLCDVLVFNIFILRIILTPVGKGAISIYLLYSFSMFLFGFLSPFPFASFLSLNKPKIIRKKKKPQRNLKIMSKNVNILSSMILALWAKINE